MIDMTSKTMGHVSMLNMKNESISYQLSTGKVLENGSDDSSLFGKILGIEDNSRRYLGIKKQIEHSVSQNKIADDTMAEIKNTYDTIKTELIQTLNAGVDDSARLAVASDMKSMRETLFTLSTQKIDGEYIFSGSDSTKQTFKKDPDFAINGKIEFLGDAILRRIAIDPATYRDRGTTGIDLMMHNTSIARSGEQLSFSETEIIIDSNNQMWKLNAAKDKIEQYDRHGVLTDPIIEKDVTNDGATPPIYTTAVNAIGAGEVMQAKHNFFEDLNVIINALEGFTTNADGTVGAAVVDNEAQNDILRGYLDTTSQQFDATNQGHAKLGNRNKVFTLSLERVNVKIVHFDILMQETNGANVSKLAMESKSLEMTYQALYSTVTRMNSMSLLNFIK